MDAGYWMLDAGSHDDCTERDAGFRFGFRAGRGRQDALPCSGTGTPWKAGRLLRRPGGHPSATRGRRGDERLSLPSQRQHALELPNQHRDRRRYRARTRGAGRLLQRLSPRGRVRQQHDHDHLSCRASPGARLGDEIVVTELDHHANVAPWRALARERGVTIRSVPFDPQTGELAWENLESVVNDKTRLVALGAASNALGTIVPVHEAARLAHAKGALCFVDAVHYAAHGVIDVQAMECDFLVCSPYKFYGPHAGVLYGRAEVMSALDAPKLEPAPDQIPDRLETGTQNHEGIVGCGAAVEFLASLASGATQRQRLVHAMSALHERGEKLFAQLWNGLTAILPPGSRSGWRVRQSSPRTATFTPRQWYSVWASSETVWCEPVAPVTRRKRKWSG